MSEHTEQVAVIQWYRYQYPKYAKYLFSIPNGGSRHIVAAVKLKQSGVLAGVSDCFLMIPKNGYHGLWLELKIKGGRVSEAQKEFMGNATLMGYQAVVCYGFEQAKDAITEYLK